MQNLLRPNVQYNLPRCSISSKATSHALQAHAVAVNVTYHRQSGFTHTADAALAPNVNNTTGSQGIEVHMPSCSTVLVVGLASLVLRCWRRCGCGCRCRCRGTTKQKTSKIPQHQTVAGRRSSHRCASSLSLSRKLCGEEVGKQRHKRPTFQRQTKIHHVFVDGSQLNQYSPNCKINKISLISKSQSIKSGQLTF